MGRTYALDVYLGVRGSIRPVGARDEQGGVVDYFGKLFLRLIQSFAMLEFSPGTGSSFLWGWIQRNRIIGKLFLEDKSQGLHFSEDCWYGGWRFLGRSFVAETGFDSGPLLLPAFGTDHGSQRQHWVDMVFMPMHPGSFQAGFHHQLVGALHDPTPDRPSLCLKGRVLDLFFAFL